MNETSLYEQIGDETIRRLVDRFYDTMDKTPETQGIRAMHPGDLGSSRDKLYWFLVGWAGGPPLYTDRFGHPRLRARHLPFLIGPSESAQWMMCMHVALEETISDDDVRVTLFSAFRRIAGHMQNQSDD